MFQCCIIFKTEHNQLRVWKETRTFAEIQDGLSTIKANKASIISVSIIYVGGAE